MTKILVINGHGRKKTSSFPVTSDRSIVTPGSAENSYTVSFEDQKKHLEQVTCLGKIWPIKTTSGETLNWEEYDEGILNDIDISPLQIDFTFELFAQSVINDTTGWGDLTPAPHRVLEQGALAVRDVTGHIQIYEKEALKDLLENPASIKGTPLFFCDKALGKIKPLGPVTLSQIYEGIGLIADFEKEEVAIVVATCSPSDLKELIHINVETEDSPLDFGKAVKSSEKVLSVKKPKKDASFPERLLDVEGEEKRPFEEILHKVESKVGRFSTYQTSCGHAKDISFTKKPAQQFLSGLGVVADIEASLSHKEDNTPVLESDNLEVSIADFDKSSTEPTLKISGKRIDRLVKSAKMYVNTAIFPQGLFQSVVEQQRIDQPIKAQSRVKCEDTKVSWQNMAVGLCHAQEVDLLVTHETNAEGKAITVPRHGEINEGDPALLLLSSPALNFGYGNAHELNALARHYIASLYRNLFNAALQEGRNYIAMPAAGLGVFGGDPGLYFEVILKVAKEFPELTVIYNPVQYGELFKKQWGIFKPSNVFSTTKDVLYLADELTKQGYPCALHNPSDSDVVYGIYDVGEYWKQGSYVGEEDIGSKTTAPLNSFNLNPNAYSRVVECSFSEKLKIVAGPHAFFEPPKPEESAKPIVSSEILEKFQRYSSKLSKEIASRWYFNKDLKRLKIKAIDKLLNDLELESLAVEVAISNLKTKYKNNPAVFESGFFSSRMHDLLEELQNTPKLTQTFM